MKNIIKNFIAVPILMFAVIAGTFGMVVPQAQAAISMQSSHPTLRASNYSDCGNNCINWNAEGATYATGDESRPMIALGIAYKNNSNTTTAQNVRIKLTPTSGNGGTTNFTGRVLADNASQVSGNSTVNIPSGATIEFTGDVFWYENGNNNNPDHINVSSNALSNGFTLGNIAPGDYGGVVAHFAIEGGEEDADLEVDTRNVSIPTITEDSAQLRGRVDTNGESADVWFEYADSLNDLSTYGDGSQGAMETPEENHSPYNGWLDYYEVVDNLDPNTTYYYQICADNGNEVACDYYESFTTDSNGNNNNFDDPDATTEDEENVDEDSAELNGEIDMNDANNGVVFFVYGQDENRIDDVENDYETFNDVENDEDQDEFMTVEADSSFNGSGSFSEDVNNLDENETYYFRICVEYEDEDNDDTLECGSVRNFDTEDEGNNNEPDATTEDPDDVDEDSAELRGEVDMNDFDNGRVFFVYGQDESQIDDVADDYDSYSDVDVDGDNLRKVSVDSDLDDQDYYTRTVSGLDENQDYYYQICVEYEDEDGDDTLECGNTEQFETDDDFTPPSDNDRPIPGACAATNLGVGSATLSARVDGNGHSTSSYFQYGRTTAFGSNTTSSSTGSNTNIVSKFVSGLSANTTYYCRVVSENTDGTSFGDIGTFRTGTLNIITPVPNTPVTIVSGGAGAPIFLEIDDERDLAVRGQVLEYDVRWENISGRNLDEVVLNVRLPKSVRFMSSTMGRYNKRDHNVTVSIGELEVGEEDDMVIYVTVRGGNEGDQLVAEATIAFEDPLGETRGLLATIEYDVDTYTNGANGQLAGLFGVGFLPGIIGLLLAILLILIIILVARRVTEPRHTEYRG